jgi:hypothetical protein
MSRFSISITQLRDMMLVAGYDDVVERVWAPGTWVDTHTHPFDVNALMVDGEMTLAVEGRAPRLLRAGDTFQLAADVPHAEQYGPQGATYWVARRAVAPRSGG